MVGCGSSTESLRIEIVDPKTRLSCPAGTKGEVWVSGLNVLRGYWNRTGEVLDTFNSYLANDSARRFLRTGDIGFQYEGSLFLVGRIKSLIIVAGENYFANDLELAAESCHPAIRPGGACAFGLEAFNQELLIIAIELDRNFREENGAVGLAVQQALVENCGVRADFVLPLRPGTLPKTSSGKIQRNLCARQLRDEVIVRGRRASPVACFL